MNAGPKRVISWSVVVIGFLGVALSYIAVWVLVAYFAAGVGWYANLALLASGPTCGIGAAIAYRKPRQKFALSLGLVGLTFWVILWVLSFAVLGFKFRS